MGEKNSKKKKRITIDHLALMVGKGFNEMSERFDQVEKCLGVLEKGQEELKKSVASLENGQEDIKANLNKKVDVIIHNELEFRVEKVEEKVGLVRKKFKTA